LLELARFQLTACIVRTFQGGGIQWMEHLAKISAWMEPSEEALG